MTKDPVERTTRGFRVFGRIETPTYGPIRVVESSLAFNGAQVWISQKQKVLAPETIGINVAEAEALIEILNTFIREAKAGQLTERESNDDH